MNNNLSAAAAYILAEPVIHAKHDIYKLEDLKNRTEVGSYIKFFTSTMIMETGKFKTREVSGIVEEKYPYIFKLDDGKYYQWVDYMLGYVF